MSDCLLCGARSTAAFQHRVLNAHMIQYYQCPRCGLLHTETPFWLPEAYARPMAASDTGLVQRNLWAARVASVILGAVCGREGPFLDVGGGYGLLVRLMRDAGFNFYWSDQHAENLFAQGYEREAEAGRFAALTLFEVLEHLAAPGPFLRELIKQTGAQVLLLSTQTFQGSPPPEDWWYYAFEGGQHIAFYQRSTLQWLAEDLGFQLLIRH